MEDVVLSADSRESSKHRRVMVLNADDEKISKLPENYLANTNKEELCLEYVRNFNGRFATLYPESEVLYNIAKNEYGVDKFVCTTLRPTLLPFREVYNLEEAAEFVANFLHYEPLEDPTSPPSCLPSPSQVLEWGCGDSFDFAVLLCSFLLGAGYDAFVVHGRASKDICLRDQSAMKCPLLVAEEAQAKQNAAEAKYADDVAESKKPSKYVMPPPTSLVSEYEQAEAKAHRAARHHHSHHRHGHGHHSSSALSPSSPKTSGHRFAESKLTDEDWLPLESKEELIERTKNTYDKFEGKRHHCWVLVRGGKRKLEGFKFIEPSTGMIYDTAESPYGNITAIFNDQNYFVKLPERSTAPPKSKTEQSFDTLNQTLWECVFIDPAKLLEEKELLKESLADAGLSEPNSPNTAVTGLTGVGDSPRSPTPVTPLPVPVNNTDASGTVVNNSLAANGGKNGTSSHHHHHHHHHHGDFIAHDDRDNILDLPPPWVGKLAVNRAALSMKYPPTGSRTVIYFKCKLELFADSIHSQGLVKRITIYRDEAQTVVDECRELFKNRRDKLESRVRKPLEGKSEDSFLPGRVGGLKKMTEWAGVRREIDFYPEARQDGLFRREEDHGLKVIDKFVGREDGMCYRSATLTEERTGAANMLWVLPPGGVRGGNYDLVTHKMAVKYEKRDVKNSEHGELAKRSFYLSEYRIRSQYHIKPGQVQPDEVTHYSDRRGSVGLSAREELELGQVVQAEKECLAAVKNYQLEMNDLTLQRRKEETEKVYLDEPIFDAAPKKLQALSMEGHDDMQEEKNRNNLQPSVDYLTPFLTGIKDPTGSRLTRQEAARVRESCLRSLKERLLERANIIQNRLNDENVKLSKRQATFQRNASRDADPAAEEEFEKFCADAMFTIGILELRLVAHEESALKKYQQLDDKLSKDPRLSALVT